MSNNNTSPNNWSENFKGRNQHKLTREDSIKGGKTSKPKCNTNNLQHGKYAKISKIPSCNNCSIKDICPEFKLNQKCNIHLDLLKGIKNIGIAVKGNVNEQLTEMAENFIRLKIMALKKPTEKNITNLLKLQMQLFELKFGKNYLVATKDFTETHAMFDVNKALNEEREKIFIEGKDIIFEDEEQD
jgi:hypothetical protein